MNFKTSMKTGFNILIALPLLGSCKTTEDSSIIRLEEGINKLEAEIRKSQEERLDEKKEESTEDYGPQHRKDQSYGGFQVAAMPFDNTPGFKIPDYREIRMREIQGYQEDKYERRARKRAATVTGSSRGYQSSLDRIEDTTQVQGNDIKGLFKGTRRLISKDYREQLEEWREEVREFAKKFPLLGELYVGFNNVKEYVEDNIRDVVKSLHLPHFNDFNFEPSRNRVDVKARFRVKENIMFYVGGIYGTGTDGELKIPFYYGFEVKLGRKSKDLSRSRDYSRSRYEP